MTVAQHDDKTRSARLDDRPGLNPTDFALNRAWTPEQRRATLETLLKHLQSYQTNFLGYQLNQKLVDLHKDLGAFLDLHINNLGDPYGDSNLGTHTKLVERAVLAYYAKLWNITPQPEPDRTTLRKVEPESAWGYVLSMGSSEGNVYGLLNARDYLSGKSLMMPKLFASDAVLTDPVPIEDKPHAYEPVIFFSQDTHYSVAKAAHTLLIPTFGETGNKIYPDKCPKLKHWSFNTWPLEVPSNENGTIDVDDLRTLVEFFAKQHHPILIVLNLGSTYKGAYDDVVEVLTRLRPILVTLKRSVQPNLKEQKSDKRDGYWIHIDGALGAAYLPFLRKAQQANRTADEKKGSRPYKYVKDAPVRDFDFGVKAKGTTPDDNVVISSIVMSGHKFPGSPWPSGIFMTRSKLQLKPPPPPEYIGSPDTTFAGSRNGFSAIVLWNFLAMHSEEEDQMKMFDECQRIAEYIEAGLATLDDKLKRTPTKDGKSFYDGVMRLDRTPHSLSIVFRKPEQHVVERFSLANVTQAQRKGDKEGLVDYSHLFVMPHVNEALAKRFIDALNEPGAFREEAWRSGPWTDAADVLQTPEPTQQVVHIATNRGFA